MIEGSRHSPAWIALGVVRGYVAAGLPLASWFAVVSLLPRDSQKRSQRIVDLVGIPECGGDLGIEDNHVAAFEIPGVVLPAYRTGEIVLGPHRVPK